jgi:hypothetical protein
MRPDVVERRGNVRTRVALSSKLADATRALTSVPPVADGRMPYIRVRPASPLNQPLLRALRDSVVNNSG